MKPKTARNGPAQIMNEKQPRSKRGPEIRPEAISSQLCIVPIHDMADAEKVGMYVRAQKLSNEPYAKFRPLPKCQILKNLFHKQCSTYHTLKMIKNTPSTCKKPLLLPSVTEGDDGAEDSWFSRLESALSVNGSGTVTASDFILPFNSSSYNEIR